MSRKLTITVPDDVYEGLRTVVGARRISRFLSDLARPHVVQCDLVEAYARMGEDEVREKEALYWAEELIGDAGEA
jgi:predicted CopG family antitoxin